MFVLLLLLGLHQRGFDRRVEPETDAFSADVLQDIRDYIASKLEKLTLKNLI